MKECPGEQEKQKVMGKYQAYPEYKDSGISWLGALPAHWASASLKHLCKLITDGSHHSPSAVDEGRHYVTVRDVNAGQVNVEQAAKISDEDFRLLERSGCRPVRGDILFSKDGTVGKVAEVENDDFVVLSSLAILRPNLRRLQSRFLFYFLHSSSGLKQIESHFAGAALKRITLDVIVNLWGSAPPIHEQRSIAAFLDHETARIDRLIEKQQRLIELLKEKRQAVISHAVTKGLDPNVPMKDSGVEWLGQVPAHWVIRRLKHTAQLQSGIPKGKDLSGKQTINVPMLRVANVQDGYIKLDDVHHIEIEPHELMRYSLRPGDVLMNEGGDNDKLGRGAVWHGQLEPCIHQNHVFAIRVWDIEPEWLSLLTGSKYAKYHFYCVAKQSTNLASISSSNIKETPLVIPPKVERQQIMEHLANMTSTLDQVSELASRQISLLQERRTALISAAVTGKIDVRNWQPNTSAQATELDLPMAAEQAAEAAPARPCARGTGSSMNGVPR